MKRSEKIPHMATALLPEMLAYGSIKMVAHSILSFLLAACLESFLFY